MTIKAILFDLDGTLVDSNDFHVKAWQEVFHDAGHAFDDRAIHEQIGKGADNFVPALLPGVSQSEQERLGDAHGHEFKSKYLDRIRAFPGARDLLIRAHQAGQRIVLASSASRGELEHYMGLLDIDDIVAQTTSADDVQSTKPAPDIFATALAKVSPLSANEVIVVGDTPYDIEAAAKCGIAAIALRSGKFSDDVLEQAGSIALYDDVAHLLADYDASPLAA